MFSYEKDIKIDDLQLWLDSKRKKEFGFISHAHGDHIARHDKILCTPATARFLEKRIKKPQCLQLPYGQQYKINDYTIELFPAGHILGSAQIKISAGSQSLLYTGDFKIHSSRTVEPFQMVKADTLIMETTFGDPHYRIPPRRDIEEQLIDTCKQLLDNDKTPIVFAYSLGKGQEALKLLTDAGLRVAVDYNILKFVPIYQEFGIDFNTFEKFKRSEFRKRILLLPPSFRFHRYIKSLPGAYTIFLSGWGMNENASRSLGVDLVLPLSDHADYSQLMELVTCIQPEKIYCTHGSNSFVDSLKAEGFNAFELG